MARSKLTQPLSITLAIAFATCRAACSQEFSRLAPWDNWSGAKHVVDVDGDCAPDILHWLATSATSSTVAVRHNTVTGGFGPSVPLLIPLQQTGGLLVFGSVPFDANGDGSIDVLALSTSIQGTTGSPGPSLLWLNPGDGRFATAVTDAIPTSVATTLLGVAPIPGDLDGNGTLDLLAQRVTGDSVVLLNDGTGHFAELPLAVPQGTPSWSFGVLGDLDGDGDLDFAGARHAQSTQQQGSIWLNDGTGHFVPVACPVLTSCDHLDVADIDGDGDEDLVFATITDVPALWINDGRGNFTVDQSGRLPPLPLPVPPPHSHSRVLFRDLDKDGDVDLVDMYVYQTRILINDGAGRFTDETMAWGMWTENLWLGFAEDLDRDGDIDLFGVRGGAAQSGVFSNLLRHVHANEPVIGGSYDIEIDGPPGFIAWYGIGLLRRDIPIPGLGTWCLDPAASVMWPRGEVLDAAGRHHASWSVPNQPQLRGVELFVQALQIDPQSNGTLHLTNPFATTIR